MPISDVCITRVTDKDPRLAAFTYPRWRFAIAAPDGSGEPVNSSFAAVAAWRDDTPLGLALFLPWESGRLCSVMVHKEHRRQGIGTALLQAGEELARSLGARRLVAVHSDRIPAREAYEALLRRTAWPAPRLHDVRLSGKAHWVASADGDWSGMLERLRRQGWSVSLFSELSAEERTHVDRLAESAPAGLRPMTANLYAPVSLAIRRHGEVVGWVNGREDLEPGHVHYPVGYVIPELQRTGWLIAALMEACRRQVAILGPDSVAHYETPPDNRPMQTFMRRRLSGRPELLRLDCMYWSEKELA